MQEITVIKLINQPHQTEHCKAAMEGFNALGIKATFYPFKIEKPKTKHVCCWGWREAKEYVKKGYKVLVMEHGYIGNRRKYSSLAWNGLNGHGIFPETQNDNGERFREHGGVLKPWKTGGGGALILCQLPGDQSLAGVNIEQFYVELANKLKMQNEPCFFRQHPVAIKKGKLLRVPYAREMRTDLADSLSRVKYSLCYNSNSSVDSILNGTPCVVFDKGSMAYEMCGKEVGDIRRPDREEWAHRLAWKQWTLEEIANGSALKRLVDVAP